MTARSDPWLTATEAATALGVTRATLYAYVSRGLVRSEPTPGPSRARRYAREDVERLRRRAQGRHDPEASAAQTLQWGLPILKSSLTLIADGRLYYRGHDAVELATSRSVAAVASLIWTGTLQADTWWPVQRGDVIPTRRAAEAERGSRGARALRTTGSARASEPPSFVLRAQVALARASARDASGYDLRPESVTRTGARILSLLTRAAGGAPGGPDIEAQLARAWRVPRRDAAIVRAALILSADHELNVSAFTARCVASAGANPYGVVLAALAALQGIRHGGMTARVHALLTSLQGIRRTRAALAARLRAGESIPGFGHPLYPDGDPRAAALLRLLRERHARSPEVHAASRVAEAALEVLRERPTIDFALAVVERVLHLPVRSALTLFAIGRSIGWVGHAIEQYATGALIRPRARYVGAMPSAENAPPEPR